MSRSFGGSVGDVAVTDEDLAVVDLLEPREHPQGRGLAAPGRADEDHELAVLDLEVDAGHRGLVRAGIPALCLLEADCCHDSYLPSPAGTCRTIRCEVTRSRAARDVGHNGCLGAAGVCPLSCRSAAHQRHRKPLDTGSALRMRASTAAAPSSANGRATEVTGRSEPAGEVRAVEGDDRHVLWHAQAALGQRLVGAHGDPVVEADQGTDRLAAEEASLTASNAGTTSQAQGTTPPSSAPTSASRSRTPRGASARRSPGGRCPGPPPGPGSRGPRRSARRPPYGRPRARRGRRPAALPATSRQLSMHQALVGEQLGHRDSEAARVA